MPPVPQFDRLWFKKDCPIVNVSWNDAQEYSKYAGVSFRRRLNGRRRLADPAAISIRGETRLTVRTLAPSGASKVVSTAPVQRTDRVSQSGYGCVDMAGNVLQWCQDNYDSAFWVEVPEGR